MPKYTVKSPINDGERREIGAIVELDDKTAKPLLDAGAVAPVVEAIEEEDTRDTANAGDTESAELDAAQAPAETGDKKGKRKK